MSHFSKYRLLKSLLSSFRDRSPFSRRWILLSVFSAHDSSPLAAYCIIQTALLRKTGVTYRGKARNLRNGLVGPGAACSRPALVEEAVRCPERGARSRGSPAEAAGRGAPQRRKPPAGGVALLPAKAAGHSGERAPGRGSAGSSGKAKRFQQ